jgi:two-component system response regulator LytT
MRILLLEGDVLSALNTEIQLKNLGHPLIDIAHSLSVAERLIQSHQIDLVICNTHINDIVVIDFFKNDPFHNLPVIFITDHTDKLYFDQTVKIKNSRFLVKPFHELTLQSIIDSLVNYSLAKGITVRGPSGQRFLVLFDAINWISVEKNYCSIFTQTKKYALKISLIKLGQQLDDRFVQVHKAYYINGDHITRTDLSGNQVFVKSEGIPIGYKFRKKLMNYLSQKGL